MVTKLNRLARSLPDARAIADELTAGCRSEQQRGPKPCRTPLTADQLQLTAAQRPTIDQLVRIWLPRHAPSDRCP